MSTVPGLGQLKNDGRFYFVDGVKPTVPPSLITLRPLRGIKQRSQSIKSDRHTVQPMKSNLDKILCDVDLHL
jgi:hypothetical protein